MGISGGRCHDLTTVMGMPPASVDPDRLRLLGAALAPLRECAREGAEEVLSQFPEVGDRETQAAARRLGRAGRRPAARDRRHRVRPGRPAARRRPERGWPRSPRAAEDHDAAPSRGRGAHQRMAGLTARPARASGDRPRQRRPCARAPSSGARLRQLATRLRITGRAAHDAFDNGDSARPGPVIVQGPDAGSTSSTPRQPRPPARSTASARLSRPMPATWPRPSPTAACSPTAPRPPDCELADGELTAAWGVSGVADGDRACPAGGPPRPAPGRARRRRWPWSANAAGPDSPPSLRASQGVLAAHDEPVHR